MLRSVARAERDRDVGDWREDGLRGYQQADNHGSNMCLYKNSV